MMNLLQEIFDMAHQFNASDIHLTSDEFVSLRINGSLFTTELFVTEEKQTKIVETVLQQEQLCKLKQGEEIDCAFADAMKRPYRVNASLSSNKLTLAIRVINSSIPSCEELLLPQEVINLADLKQGLVLVCGATGSGKSTTLAALINKINLERRLHIITLEDPIEYRHVNNKSIVHQREVGRDTRSFVKGLHSALRQDPDVILVGELRDRETTAAALTAAETGHLVFATLHCREATGAINRILDMFDEGRELIKTQLANVIEGIVCQELVCNLEGVSRRASFQVLLASPALRSLIREGKSHQINGYQMVKIYK